MPERKVETIFGVHPVMETLKSGRAPGGADPRFGGEAGSPGAGGPLAGIEEEDPGPAGAPGSCWTASPAEVCTRGSWPACRASGPVSVEEILASAGNRPFFLILDQVEDPRNLGAVLRTAAAARVDGVFLPPHGSAPLTPR